MNVHDALRAGGEVRLPPGEFIVDASIFPCSNTHIIGAGAGLTKIRLADGANVHMLQHNDVENVRWSALTIDGNRDAQTAGVHCIRANGVERLVIDKDVVVCNARSYAIGIKRARNSSFSGTLHTCGADGIDFKNLDSNNFNNRVVDLTVYRWGLNPDLHEQAAVDIRGHAQARNITAYWGPDDGTCFRFREGGAAHGAGGHDSSLIGGYFQGAGVKSLSVGVDWFADDCTVKGVRIRDCSVALDVLGKRPEGLDDNSLSKNGLPIRHLQKVT